MTGHDKTWWALRGDSFMQALRRVEAGEDPDLIYAEYYANTVDGDLYIEQDGED